MLQRRDMIAAGVGLVAALTIAAVWRGLDGEPPADAPQARPQAPTAPATTATHTTPTPPTTAPAPEPAKPVDPLPVAADELKDDPVEDPRVHAQWQERLAREDEALVQQAIAAGCDAERAEQMRRVLAEKRAARARTIEEYRAGRISNAEMRARAVETRRRAEVALQEILTAKELAALDPEGARASVIDREQRD